MLIVGGDITGKQVIPIIEDEAGRLTFSLNGKTLALPSNQLGALKRELGDVGYYPFECNLTDYNRFSTDREFQRSTINNLVADRIREWVRLADERLPSRDECQVFINPGNDDPYLIDSILDSSHKLVRPEGQIYDLPAGIKLLSCGYSNWTPWDCPRQCAVRGDESELSDRIAAMTSQIPAQEYNKVIFNFHCPPFDTPLDLANKIDPITKQKIVGIGGAAKEHVGSTAVRQSIEFWKPLAGLHGHIHEVVTRRAQLGSTVCFNPGTVYYTGHLQGVFLQINKRGEIEAEFITEEKHTRDTNTTSGAMSEAALSAIPVIGHAIEVHQARMRDEEVLRRLKHLEHQLREIKLEATKQDERPIQ